MNILKYNLRIINISGCVYFLILRVPHDAADSLDDTPLLLGSCAPNRTFNLSKMPE